MCVSVQGDNAYLFFRGSSGVRLGYCDFENDELLLNQGTQMGTGSSDSKICQKKFLETLSFKNKTLEETSETGMVNEVDIKPRNPNYIFCFDRPSSLDIKIASEYGIPIVSMDSKAYYQKYYRLFEGKAKYFDNYPDRLTLEDFKELYTYDRQMDLFRLGDKNGIDTRYNEEYKYRNFFRVFKNWSLAQVNPSFYDEILNYVTNNQYQIDELKEYITREWAKVDKNLAEKVPIWFEGLEQIHKRYIDEQSKKTNQENIRE